VGDKRWEQWMAKVCKPFTMAHIQYFDASRIEEAWKWLQESA
jgi:stage II sporulation SpoAA-like protein